MAAIGTQCHVALVRELHRAAEEVDRDLPNSQRIGDHAAKHVGPDDALQFSSRWRAVVANIETASSATARTRGECDTQR